MALDRIFDFHLHLCRTAADEARVYPRPGWQESWFWANEERLSTYLDFWGVEKAVVPNIMDTRRMMIRRRAAAERSGSTAPDEKALIAEMKQRVHRFNAWLFDFAVREQRILPFAMADPVLFEGEIEEEVKSSIAAGARGLKIHPGICRHLPADPRALPIYSICERSNIPILTDTYGIEEDGVTWGAPSHWQEVLPHFPKLRIVLAHLPGERWDEMIELADRYSNCWFDISGGFVDEAHPPTGHRRMPIEEAARVIRRIGVDRVLFGSDAPAHGREIVDSAAQLLQLDLTEGEKSAILFQNAYRFFGE